MKKEDFFEILGSLDGKLVEEANKPIKKKLNWKVLSSIAACFVLAAVLSIAAAQNRVSTDEVSSIGMKPLINFEGIVTDVDGNSITLNSGKIVLITEETRFMGDPDTRNEVSKDIVIGNYIQGYTEDAADAAEITASKIWTNKECAAEPKNDE